MMDLIETIESVMHGDAELDAISDYCDAMKKTPESLRELKDAIKYYDGIPALYECLFNLFADDLNSAEKSFYRKKYR